MPTSEKSFQINPKYRKSHISSIYTPQVRNHPGRMHDASILHAQGSWHTLECFNNIYVTIELIRVIKRKKRFH